MNLFRCICSNTPKWVGEFNMLNGFSSHNVELVNACTIDYFLFYMWILYKKLGPSALSQSKDAITNKHEIITDLIDNNKWNDA